MTVRVQVAFSQTGDDGGKMEVHWFTESFTIFMHFKFAQEIIPTSKGRTFL